MKAAGAAEPLSCAQSGNDYNRTILPTREITLYLSSVFSSCYPKIRLGNCLPVPRKRVL